MKLHLPYFSPPDAQGSCGTVSVFAWCLCRERVLARGIPSSTGRAKFSPRVRGFDNKITTPLTQLGMLPPCLGWGECVNNSKKPEISGKTSDAHSLVSHKTQGLAVARHSSLQARQILVESGQSPSPARLFQVLSVLRRAAGALSCQATLHEPHPPVTARALVARGAHVGHKLVRLLGVLVRLLEGAVDGLAAHVGEERRSEGVRYPSGCLCGGGCQTIVGSRRLLFFRIKLTEKKITATTPNMYCPPSEPLPPAPTRLRRWKIQCYCGGIRVPQIFLGPSQ